MRVAIGLVALALGCTPRDPPRADVDDAWPDPVCEPLPAQRPAAATIAISRRDGQTLERTIDAVFVDDAPCPISPILPPPECLRTDPAAMDAIWAELVAIELHRVEQERHGECIHCGGPWITIEWPSGGCSRGLGVRHDVARASWERFDRAVRFLEGIVTRVHARGAAPSDADEATTGA